MRKPSRPPPPPPLPPRQGSPAATFLSLSPTVGQFIGGGSEYAESVASCAISTHSFRSHQNNMIPSISRTSCCNSTRNVCLERTTCCCSCNSSSYYSCSSSSFVKPCQIQQVAQCPMANPCLSTIPCVSPCTSFSNGTNQRRLDSIDGPDTMPPVRPPPRIPKPLNTPPVPRERTLRAKLVSRSPMPMLRNNRDHTETRVHEGCKPLYYKRHIEQHVERLHKYLEDREARRKECEAGLDRNQNQYSQNTILQLLADKERSHLRSRRARMSSHDFEKVEKLGAGFMGNVWLVKKRPRNSESEQLFAMKILKKSQVFQQNHMAHVMAERDILAEADNEWIVKLYYSFQDIEHLYFILEYIPGGDLMNLLCEECVFPESWARFYIAEISLALQFVHNMGFIHRDIKPDNILIDSRGHIKLTDFGLCTGFRWTHDSRYYQDDNSTNQNDTKRTSGGYNFDEDHPTITTALTKREIEHAARKRSLSLVGSPNYIAPEVLRQAFSHQENTNERLCDWWSVGVILYEMVIGYCPFIDLEKLKQSKYDVREDPPNRIQYRILNWKNFLAFPSPYDNNGPPLIKGTYIQKETEDLIKGLLRDPHDRLCQNGIKDIQNHPFFAGIDWLRIRQLEAPRKPIISHPMDTRNFDTSAQMALSARFDHSLSFGNNTKMVMNDFTYRCFWSKPLTSYS